MLDRVFRILSQPAEGGGEVNYQAMVDRFS
jgi:hypothetical protein